MQLWAARLVPGMAHLSLRLGAVMPSGKVNKLSGKGATDVFAELTASTASLFDLPINADLNVGVLRQGGSDLFNDLKSEVYYSHGRLAHPLGRHWSLRAQYLLHSAAFNSSLRVLGKHSLLLYGGLARQIAGFGEVSVGISEDPEYGTAQDVGFHLAAHLRFR